MGRESVICTVREIGSGISRNSDCVKTGKGRVLRYCGKVAGVMVLVFINLGGRGKPMKVIKQEDGRIRSL